MDDDWGYPYFRKPPFARASSAIGDQLCVQSPGASRSPKESTCSDVVNESNGWPEDNLLFYNVVHFLPDVRNSSAKMFTKAI